MPPSWLRRISLQVLACLLSAASALADEPLRYRCEPGSRVRMTIENDFQLPILGTQLSQLTVDSRVLSASASGARVLQSIERTRPGQPLRTVDTALGFTPTGDVSGPDDLPADSEGVFLARTTLLLLPALPDEVVRVGSTWSAIRTFPLPPMKISAPPQVRVRINYRVTSFAQVAGQRVVNIDMSGRSLPDEGLTLTNTGQLTLDAATGRPLSGFIDGKATMSVFLLGSMTAGFKIRLVSSTIDVPAGEGQRGRIALLGVE